LAVELQAQGHLRRSAENTVPEGCCRAPISYEFHRCLRSPHLGPVRGAGSGSGRAVGVMGHRPLPALGDGPEIQLRGLHRVGGCGCPSGSPRPSTNGPGAPSKEPRRDFCMIGAQITLPSGPRRFLP